MVAAVVAVLPAVVLLAAVQLAVVLLAAVLPAGVLLAVQGVALVAVAAALVVAPLAVLDCPVDLDRPYFLLRVRRRRLGLANRLIRPTILRIFLLLRLPIVRRVRLLLVERSDRRTVLLS